MVWDRFILVNVIGKLKIFYRVFDNYVGLIVFKGL